jgi:hypothetical protein
MSPRLILAFCLFVVLTSGSPVPDPLDGVPLHEETEAESGGTLTNVLMFPAALYKRLPLSEQQRIVAGRLWETIDFTGVLTLNDNAREFWKSVDQAWSGTPPPTTTPLTTVPYPEYDLN